jgi:hypothetical protein
MYISKQSQRKSISADGESKHVKAGSRKWLENIAKAKIIPPSQVSKDGEYLEAGRRALRSQLQAKYKNISGEAWVGNVRSRTHKSLFETYKYHNEADLQSKTNVQDRPAFVSKEGAPLIKTGVTSLRHRSTDAGMTGVGVSERYLKLDFTKDIGWMRNPYVNTYVSGHRDIHNYKGLPFKIGANNTVSEPFDKGGRDIGRNYFHNPYDKFEPKRADTVAHSKPFDSTGRLIGAKDVQGMDGKPNLPAYIPAGYEPQEYTKKVLNSFCGVGQGFRPVPRKNFKGAPLENSWR